jgi:hypothetical protein
MGRFFRKAACSAAGGSSPNTRWADGQLDPEISAAAASIAEPMAAHHQREGPILLGFSRWHGAC